MRLLPALLLLIFAQLAPAAEPLGRLFYTPEQRTQLDALRTQRVVATQVRDEPVPENVTYNGIVRRSDGKTTVWVNNEAMTEAELRVKQSIVGRVDRNGRILLQTPQASGAAQLQLKVGQSAELLSGKIDEPYAAQRAAPAAKIKPAATEKPAATDPGAATARPRGGGDAGTAAPADNKGQPAARP